jgi:hypothetical protein
MNVTVTCRQKKKNNSASVFGRTKQSREKKTYQPLP